MLTLAWLVATVLAATVAWWAVSAVGGERGGDGGGLLSQAQVAGELADQRAEGPGAGQPTDGGPSADASPSPSPSPDPTPSTTSTPEPATSSPAPGTATTPAPPVAADVARTWDVTGGQVGAVCTGATIALVYATPADGWSVEVDHAGPDELEIDFVRGGDESRLRAECVAGTPEITRSGDDGSGSGSDDGSGGGSDDGSGRRGGGSGGGDDGSDDD